MCMVMGHRSLENHQHSCSCNSCNVHGSWMAVDEELAQLCRALEAQPRTPCRGISPLWRACAYCVVSKPSGVAVVSPWTEGAAATVTDPRPRPGQAGDDEPRQSGCCRGADPSPPRCGTHLPSVGELGTARGRSSGGFGRSSRASCPCTAST